MRIIDFLLDNGHWIIAGFGVLLIAGIFYSADYEKKNCLKYGASETHTIFISVGKIMVPSQSTSRPCILWRKK